MSQRIVIIGSGMAGITLARELRKLDKAADIFVLSRECGDFYSKPALSNALARGKTAEALVLTPALKLAQDLQARIVANVAVTAIDTRAKSVASTAGVFTYDALVLAIGASQRTLALDGDAAHAILSVNNLADYARFRGRLEGKQAVAIVGAGLIGCEFANDLRVAGMAVDVYDVADQPLGRLLPADASVLYRQKLEAIGVRFHLRTALARIDQSASGYVLTTGDGAMHSYDLVLSAIGLQPNVALAQSARLEVGVGVRTDRLLRTNVPDVYALGDCAEVDGLILPYVLPITHGAKALARTLLGEPTEVQYPAMPVVVKTPVCPAAICLPPTAGGVWEVSQDAGGLRALHRSTSDAVMDGFVLLGTHVKERMALAAQVRGPLPASTPVPV